MSLELAFPTRRSRRAVRLGVVLVLAMLAGPRMAAAQTVRGDLAITNGQVNAEIAWGGKLFLGGSFTNIGPRTGGGVPVDTTAGAVVPGFPMVTGVVNTAASDSAGGWYIGGSFTSVGGQARNHLAHVRSDLSVAAWNPAPNQPVLALALRGGVLYAGGEFTTIGGQARARIAAIDTASGLANVWNPGADQRVRALVATDSVVYAGGDFLNIGGVGRTRLAALDAGTGATSPWNPAVNGSVFALEVGGGIVYAGGFFSVIGGQPRIDLAAVSATTGLVTSWNPKPDNQVFALALSGSRLYVGGAFTKFNLLTARNRIAALDVATGVPVVGFDPNANNTVLALWTSGSTVYAGGGFTTIGGQPRTFLAAVTAASGTLTAWNPTAYGTVNALAPGGAALFVGGSFNGIGGAARRNIAQVDLTSGAVTAWDPDANGQVFAFAPHGGTMVVGGQFTSLGGQARNNLAAVDVASGAVTSWNPNVNGAVSALAMNAGTVYAGGVFSNVGGQLRNNLAAVDTTTGLPTAWNPDVDGQVFTIAPSGNAIYIGGFFFTVSGQARNEAAAVDAGTGALLPWNPNSNGTVRALVPTCGSMFACGFFTSLGGQPRSRIAQLDLTTGAATSWNANADGPTLALALTGGALYASGLFSNIGGQSRARLAALNPVTGSATSWNPGADNIVRAFAIDGTTIYVGGGFGVIAGVSASNLAGLTADTTLTCPAIALSPATLPDGRLGVAYAQGLSASGGSAPYCWAISAGALPAGISLNPANGQLAGTPTVSGDFSFRVSASTVSGCKGSQTYALHLFPACPVIAVTPSPLPLAHRTEAYSVTLLASAGVAPFVFSVTAGALPPGLTLTPGGLLAGTPSTLGTSNFTVTVVDSSGCAGATALSIPVFPACTPLAVAPELVPDGVVGASFDQALTVTGGRAPYAWTVTGGSLPSGLVLDALTGHVHGTPALADTFPVVITATDSIGCVGSRAYTIAIFGAAPTSFVSANTAGLMITNGATCVRVPVDFTRTIPDSMRVLHVVVQLDAAQLALCTPAQPDSSIRPGSALVGAGAASFTVTDRGAGAYAVDFAFTGSPCGLGAGGSLFTLDLVAAGADGGGTIAVTALRARGCDDAILPVSPGGPALLTINRTPLVLRPAALPGGAVGDAYAFTLSTNAGTAPFAWSVVSGALPAGLTLDGSTGALTGVPTTVETANFTLSAADVNGRTGTRSYGVPVFATTPTSFVNATAAGLCITTSQPFVVLPFDLVRTDATPTRALSVTFQLDPARLALRTPLTPSASIHVGTWFAGFGNTSFFVTDNGGGSYTVDLALLGQPCGITTGGRLFTVDVAGPGPDGPGAVDVIAVRARDCSNGAIALAGGPEATIPVDRTGPAGVTDLAAAQRAVDGSTTQTTRIALTWTPAGTPANLYRAPRGAHPLYLGAAARPDSSLVPGGPWVLVATNPAPGVIDQPATRGVWCYVLLASDSCGVRALSNETEGTLDYFLADVSDETTPGTGNNSVNVEDMSLLGAHYGLTGAGAVDPFGYLDVGPTADATPNSRPLPDHNIDFEDLFVFAGSYGIVTGPPAAMIELAALGRPRAGATSDAPERFSVIGPGRAEVGSEITATLHLSAAGRMQGFSVRLAWDNTVLAPIAWESAGGLEGAGAIVLAPSLGTVDAAMLGRARGGMAIDGDVARVRFRVLKSGLTGLGVAMVDARDAANHRIDGVALAAELAAPAQTVLFAPAPNPTSGEAGIAFALAHAGPVRLGIYSVSGRLVRALVSGVQPAGEHQVAWDGRDGDGRLAAAGVYYFHLEADGLRMNRSVVLLR